MYHERSKHIDVKFHFVQQIILNGIVENNKIASVDNLDDMVTKAFTRRKVQILCKVGFDLLLIYFCV